MAGFQTPITIYDAIRHIDSKEYLLPAFQREFVWSTEQIEQLFDSLMQGYPISSMLFWKVRWTTTTDFNFYDFLKSYTERYNTHNDLRDNISRDFYAILDGQQRLTALNIGLQGSYAYHEYRKSWENNPQSFPERKLYLCVSKTNTSDDLERKFLFFFEKTTITENKDLYTDNEGEIWFRVGKILSLGSSVEYGLDEFFEDNRLGKEAKTILRLLWRVIFVDRNINFYEEEDQNPDKAVNIFTRINSGGTYLSFSDIMFSLMVANWKKDARTEITELIDRINNKGFSVTTDYILKSFLFLYHKTIKSSINSFSKKFCKVLEDNWEKIRDSIDSLFDLLRTFGLTNSTLTSNNATLPILYYIYHKEIYLDFANRKGYENDRIIIKNWLLSALLRQGFGGQSDSALSLARKAFTNDIEKQFIENQTVSFPAVQINENLKKHLATVDDDLIEELLGTQKDDKYCFSILSILYPNMDYKNNNFHKDHMHPEDRYDELPERVREDYPFWRYNSIVNLQMLDANENESKGKMLLKEWVDKEIKHGNKQQFYNAHLIPEVDLTQTNFAEFYEERYKILSDKLKAVLV